MRNSPWSIPSRKGSYVESRPIPSMPSTTPDRLPAYPCEDGAQVRVWCPYCNAWHYHGAGTLGHRVAHCHNVDSPYLATGYVLADPRKFRRRS